ncbi:MAG TPA: YIP1 family protein [Methanocorpusculum sp.]|nr:YIP1 family protein [Methanocorpusculum sp.]
MDPIIKTIDLFVDQKKFFEENNQKNFPVFLIILLSAVVSGIYTWLSTTQIEATSAIPKEFVGTITGLSIAGAVIGTIVFWIIDSLLFFISLKIFGHSNCRFGEILKISGYAIGIDIFHTVILILVFFVGQPVPIALFLLSIVFLAWKVPIWFFGFKSLNQEMAKKELVTSVFVPAIIIAIVTFFSSGILV